jgi:aspartyl-tRNA(Asn)/glutamyl-tRNA(Gln) amidotransferase subunit A
MNTKQKLGQIKSSKLSAVDNIKSFLDTIKKKNKDINAFLYIAEKEALEQAKKVDEKIKKGSAGKLAGLAIAVKACINVVDMPISCASKTLENYNGTYDADVVEKIKKEDGIIIGIANMDCFACGSSGESSMFGATKNPRCDRIPGGSSSGSAAAVASNMCDIALGTDTGGSIRNPASHCGIVGVKPSYGRVSRYGLVDLSMSLDQIGPLCNDVYGCALMMEVISGHSNKDSVTYENKVEKYSDLKKISGLKIGMSKEFEKLCQDKKIYALIKKKAEELAKKTKSNIVSVDLPNIELAVQAYYPIVYVELYSGTRKLDGRKYGKKIEESCSEEVLRRILGGKEISRAEHGGKYYRKALAAKNLISETINKAFDKVDFIILPTTPALPRKLGAKTDPKTEYASDAFTIPANLAGICAGVIPAGEIDGVPIGMQIFAKSFDEERLFSLMESAQNN